MEVVKRRTELAVKQAARKKRIVQEKMRRRDWRSHHEELNVHRREELDAIKASRQRQKEDWKRGSLRPRRELVGDMPIQGDSSREANAKWGTYSSQRLRKPQLPVEERLIRRNLVLRTGDRVCVDPAKVKGTKMRGHATLKIGTIKKIDCFTGYATVTGVNMVDQEVPEASQQPGQDPIDTTEEPVPYDALRLVHPTHVLDPTTGKIGSKDIIIDQSALRLRYATAEEPLSEAEERNAFDYEAKKHDDHFVAKPYGKAAFRYDEFRCEYFPNPVNRGGPRFRYIVPQRLRIPWPATPESRRIDEAGDTGSANVQERTFQPTLLRPPMPEGVLDELRSRTSKFRTRHDDEYVAKKEAHHAARVEQEAIMEEMRPKGARNVSRSWPLRELGYRPILPAAEEQSLEAAREDQIEAEALEEEMQEDLVEDQFEGLDEEPSLVDAEAAAPKKSGRRDKAGNTRGKAKTQASERKQASGVERASSDSVSSGNEVQASRSRKPDHAQSTASRVYPGDSTNYLGRSVSRSTSPRAGEAKMRKADVEKTRARTHHPKRKDRVTGGDLRILEMLGKHMATKRAMRATIPPPGAASQQQSATAL